MLTVTRIAMVNMLCMMFRVCLSFAFEGRKKVSFFELLTEKEVILADNSVSTAKNSLHSLVIDGAKNKTKHKKLKCLILRPICMSQLAS